MGLLDELKRRLTGRADPAILAAEVDRALALHEAGNLDGAEAVYRSVLELHPRHPEALHLLGVVQHQRGDNAAALQSINAAILAEPGNALYHFNLGNVLTAMKEPEAAAAAFAQAVKLRPAYATAWCNLGKSHLELDQLADAIKELHHAFELDPGLPGLRFDLATALITQGDRHVGSKAFHEKAAALLENHWQQSEHPDSTRLMYAYSLQQSGRLSEAETQYRGVLQGRPEPGDELKAHSNLANCCNQLGRMDDALVHYRRALEMNPALADTASSIAACINYAPEATPQDVLEAHRDWARRFGVAAKRGVWMNNRDPGRRLRVGLVSPDLRRHPVTALCASMLERLATHGIDLYCYYNFPSSDVVTERLRKAASAWRDVHALNDEALAAKIEGDAIDILVDLAGHTTMNRLGVFARKPAPLQVSWLGYFNSTGLETFDAFLSDPYSSPPGQDTWFVEKLVRLPHTRFCYEPWEFTPEVNALPARNAGHVTFGCFNNLAKINDTVLALWARVLQDAPGAKLVVQAQSLNDAPNRERFSARAETLGIARARLELRDFVPLEQAMRGYHGIDIALDPFPFCGGMTSFESLWMGVPVVTLEQPLIAGRQTLSMLNNLGLPELVAHGEDEYVAIAAGLAKDLPRLEALRRELRPRFAASPLADYDGYARDWAAAMRELWRTWAHGAR